MIGIGVGKAPCERVLREVGFHVFHEKVRSLFPETTLNKVATLNFKAATLKKGSNFKGVQGHILMGCLAPLKCKLSIQFEQILRAMVFGTYQDNNMIYLVTKP